MSDFSEKYFSRLRKDKDFANEVLLYKSHELLKSAFDLYLKEPDRMNEIINSIGYSIDKHLNTKNKLKVIHIISKEMGSLQVIGLRNMYLIGNTKITEFNKELYNTLQWIEDKEEGKIQEREEILQEIHPIGKNIILYKTFTGFQTTLTDEQIGIHYNKLKGRYIDNSTKLINYTAVFRDSFLPEEFMPVKWILLNRLKQAHKTALREFLTFALNKSPDQKTINICFTDRNGSKIQLAKPKIIEYSNHFSFFEGLFKH